MGSCTCAELICFYAELKLNDDPTATISVLAQVRVKSILTLSNTLILFCQSLDMLRAIIDDAVKVLEQTKAVLDHLGSAKQFLRTIMELGAIACELIEFSITCQWLDLKNTVQLHPIAKAVFCCVNMVYEVSEPKSRTSIDMPNWLSSHQQAFHAAGW